MVNESLLFYFNPVFALIENDKVGSLTDMSGSQQLIESNESERASAVTDIGFNFIFMGKVYNTFSVNTNGVLRLGDEQVVAGANTYGIPGNDRIVAMAGWSYERLGFSWSGWRWFQEDAALATLNNGKVHYKVNGFAPNRVLVVEWKNVGFGNSYTTFQVRLHESTVNSGQSGKIEFVYDTFNLNEYNRNFTFRTGFGIGPEAGNFVAVDHKSRTLVSTQNYVSTISDNNDNNNVRADDFSGSGTNNKLLLSFETPKKPAGQFSNFAETCKGANAITVSFEENCPDEAGIAVYRKLYGQDDSQFTLIKSLEPDARSMSDGSITTGKQYVYRFYLLSEGKYADTYQDYTSATIEAGAAYQTVSSGAWTDANIWGGNMPGSEADVAIGCGGAVSINANADAQVKNLTIEQGSSLTIDDGVTLRISGDFINHGVFNPVDNARVVFNGNTEQAIINHGQGTSNDLVFKRLTINNSSNEGVILNSRLHIQNRLQLTNGIVHTTAEAAIFLEAGAQANEGSATSFVDGPMYKQGNTNFTFPVGDGGKWSPVTLRNMTAADNNTVFMAEYFKVGYGQGNNRNGINNVSQHEFWEIEPVSGNPTVDICLHWKDAAFSNLLGAIASHDLVVAHYTNGEWVNEGGMINLVDTENKLGYLEVSGINTFSPFTFGSEGSSTLPVELLSFNAIQEQAGVVLNWETASEQDNSHFEVQRSTDNKNWSVIGRVKGSGTTQLAQQYAFVDAEAWQGNYFYRLKQLDFNGDFEYSKIVYVNLVREEQVFSVYPNPATDHITVRSSSYPAIVDIISLSGGIVAQHQITEFQTTLQLPMLKAGVYILKLNTQQGIKHEKIIINAQ